MKFRFSKKWKQNGLIALCVGVAIAVITIERDVIEFYASPQNFFFAVSAVVSLFVIVVLLSAMISQRADAVAVSRTADLLETQKLFVELYRNSPVPYVLIDHKGRVTYPNHAALHLFGLEEDTFEGRDMFDMFEAIDDEGGVKTAMIESTFKQGVFVDGRDVLIKRADGATRYGLLSIFSYGDFGTKKKGLTTIVDITKQKEIENAKSEFVSLASHQLRTPVSSMKWNLELMIAPQFGGINEKQNEYVVKITNGLLKMNNLIDDFLNVSQLELGTKTIKMESIELGSFMDDVAEEFVGRVEEKHLKLQKSYDDRVASIESDRPLLHMAVSNLVSNATKYTPDEGTVSIEYVAGATTLTISVTDTGIGIPADDQEKLFTKFFRAENVREKVIGGTGLGLYIVKLAVLKLGGT
ncbi:MAG: PAS domain S-box-containing protein, partial [Candidatus Azotimanducaceae bacterium]